MTSRIEYLAEQVLYDNPIPHVRSRHGFFPTLIQLPSSELLAMVAIGEAFESPDMTTYVLRSADRGESWQLQGPVYDKSVDSAPTSDYLKPLRLDNGSLIALGYRFDRADPEQSISVVETGGILPGDDIVSFSNDEGRTWTVPRVVPRSTPELLEIPNNPILLRSGDLVASAGLFKMEDGSNPSGQFGVIVRSTDNGETWDDKSRFYESPGRSICAYESGICQMDDGRLVSICWAFEINAGKDHPNQVTVSHDDGHRWSTPIDTGHKAQSVNLISLAGNRLMSIHCHRGEEVGLVVRLVDFSNDQWNVITEQTIWGADIGQQVRDGQEFHEMMARIRFGNPSLLQLDNGEILAVHWAVVNGQGRILSHRLRVVD